MYQSISAEDEEPNTTHEHPVEGAFAYATYLGRSQVHFVPTQADRVQSRGSHFQEDSTFLIRTRRRYRKTLFVCC